MLMDARASIRKGMLLAGLGLLSAGAQTMRDEVRLKYQYYTDNNGSQVAGPVAVVVKKAGEHAAVDINLMVDGISAASRSHKVRNLSVDAVSGASERETRWQWGAGLTGLFLNTLVRIAAGRSEEDDYHSLSGGASLRQDLFRKNSTISAEYNLFRDRQAPQSNWAFQRGRKWVNDFTLGWTQVLSPRTTADVSWGGILSNGFLGRPYYHVAVDDTVTGGEAVQLFYESYPRERAQYAVSAGLRQHYPSFVLDGAVHGEYRYVSDNWGIGSHAMAVDLFQYLVPLVYFKLHYRFYSQDAAGFYQDYYSLADVARRSYMTVDPRLSALRSHEFGIKLSFDRKNEMHFREAGPRALVPARLDLSLNRYMRGTSPSAEVRDRRYEAYDFNGLDAWIYRVGVAFLY